MPDDGSMMRGWAHLTVCLSVIVAGCAEGRCPAFVHDAGVAGACPRTIEWAPVANDLVGPGETVNAIWGSGADDVWVVGWAADPVERALVLRRSSAGWQRWATGSRSGLLAVWGSAADDVWFAGGNVVHWDGASWNEIGQTGGAAIGGGCAAHGPWVAVDGVPPPMGALPSRDPSATFMRYDGHGWSRSQVAPDAGRRGWYEWTSIAATSGSDVWAAGYIEAWQSGAAPDALTEVLLHYDGDSWSPAPFDVDLPVGVYGSASVALAVWIAAPDDVWVGGSHGPANDLVGLRPMCASLHRFDGTNWTAMPLPDSLDPTPEAVSSIWGSSANDVWVAAPPYGLLHWDGATWTSTAMGPAGGGSVEWNGLRTVVWGADPCHVWFAGGAMLFEGAPH
jgi:hypothetical protein